MVSQTIREIFKSMSGALEEKIQDLFQRRIAGNRAMQKTLNFELGKHREQLTKLQMEIACQLLKRVGVGRDYINMTYSQFCTEWNANEFLDTLLHSTDNEPDENMSYHGMNLC